MTISYQNYKGSQRQSNYGVPTLESIATQRPYSFAELNQLVYKAIEDALKQGLQTIVQKSTNLGSYLRNMLPQYPVAEPLNLIYFSKRANEKKREDRRKEREKKKQKTQARMKSPTGGSRYARKSADGNSEFWAGNPFNKPPVREEEKSDIYRRLRRFNSF